jgi:hypothetical protein
MNAENIARLDDTNILLSTHALEPLLHKTDRAKRTYARRKGYGQDEEEGRFTLVCSQHVLEAQV